MIIFKNAVQLTDFLSKMRDKKKKIGFVPTMGALHKGHLALINSSVNSADITIASVFVNPTQFNDPEDFKKYPVTIESDIQFLESSGCNILFLPAVSEVYPFGLNKLPQYELGFLETILEGEFRPGHFQGVCQVVHRLVEIINPDYMFLGQKDFQQCLVIKKLLSLLKLGNRIELKIVPTVREDNGLALSSRNKRLSKEGRTKASEISKELLFIKKHIKETSINDLVKTVSANLKASGFEVDYVKIANAESLSPINNWDGQVQIVAVIAALIDGVRLIDNMTLN